MRVLLVRHGQSEGNIIPVIQGQMDYPLTEKGKAQAHKAGKELQSIYYLDKIYSSDLLRAAKTAEIIATYFNIKKISFIEKLREFHFGKYQDRKSVELTREESAHLKYCWNNTTERLPGGETVDELSNRVTEAFNEIINSNNENSTILIVTHRRALYVLLKTILGSVPVTTSEWFKNCSVNELVRDNPIDKWKLVRFDNKYQDVQ